MTSKRRKPKPASLAVIIARTELLIHFVEWLDFEDEAAARAWLITRIGDGLAQAEAGVLQTETMATRSNVMAVGKRIRETRSRVPYASSRRNVDSGAAQPHVGLSQA